MADDKKPPPQVLGTGAARQAATALTTRRERLEEAEKKDTGYAAGGSVKAPSQAAIKAYSREYDTIRPAGRNVHEDNRTKRRFSGGGTVSTRRGYGKAKGA